MILLPYVLDRNLNRIDVIDDFVSFIWTKRFNKVGDFELYVPASNEALISLTEDNYIVREDDEMVCVIEKVELKTDVENGDFIAVSGRSVESFLDRRIIWQQTNYNGRAEIFIRKIIDENVVNPKIATRKIPNFFLNTEIGYNEKITIQTTGANLLDVVEETCGQFNFGFRVKLRQWQGKSNCFVFELYKGVDRSALKTIKPFVVFSPEFDNLFSSEYIFDKTPLKNSALVAGEGEGTARKTVEIGANASGIDRREIYVDARDISSNDGEISESDYKTLLEQRGNEQLKALQSTEAFSGEVETTKMYQYKKNYNLGDIVEVQNEYGITATPRIIEIIECEDENGYSCIPTFSTWGVN